MVGNRFGTILSRRLTNKIVFWRVLPPRHLGTGLLTKTLHAVVYETDHLQTPKLASECLYRSILYFWSNSAARVNWLITIYHELFCLQNSNYNFWLSRPGYQMYQLWVPLSLTLMISVCSVRRFSEWRAVALLLPRVSSALFHLTYSYPPPSLVRISS